MTLTCPDCSEVFTLPEDVRVGTILICNNCGAEVEVTSVDPLEASAIEEMK